ncbi:MAG: thioesterase family protein [Acidimicrobiales bacterium]
MQDWDFDTETAVRLVEPGRWTTDVSDRWNIGDNPNGGYLVTSVLRAMSELSSHTDPLTVTTHFLRPGSALEAGIVEAELIRTGRTLSTLRGRLVQNGKGRVEVLAAFTDLSTSDEPLVTIAPPDLPPVEDCVERSGLEQGVDLPIMDRTNVRLHPSQAQAGAAGEPVVSGWIRFVDGREPDTLSLLLFADAFPPSLFGTLGYVGWVPTVEMTVHIRRRPAPGWIRGRFEATDLTGGRVIESGQLWDSTGALVAQTRQIGLLLT